MEFGKLVSRRLVVCQAETMRKAALAAWEADLRACLLRSPRTGIPGQVVLTCGGSSPKELFELLVGMGRDDLSFGYKIDTLLFGPLDERIVDAGDQTQFNLHGLREALFSPLGLEDRQLCWYDPAEDLKATGEVLPGLNQLNDDFVHLAGGVADIIFAGLGPVSAGFAHCASLFTNVLETDEIWEKQGFAAVRTDDKPPPRRITATPHMLFEAQTTVVHVTRGREDVLAAFTDCQPTREGLTAVPGGMLKYAHPNVTDPLCLVITDCA